MNNQKTYDLRTARNRDATHGTLFQWALLAWSLALFGSPAPILAQGSNSSSPVELQLVGKWPEYIRGHGLTVCVAGDYAYVEPVPIEQSVEGRGWDRCEPDLNRHETARRHSKRYLMMGLARHGGGWLAPAHRAEPNGVRHGPVVPIGRFHRPPDRSPRPRPTENSHKIGVACPWSASPGFSKDRLFAFLLK